VLILADDLGYSTSAATAAIATPHLDGLAAGKGVRFHAVLQHRPLLAFALGPALGLLRPADPPRRPARRRRRRQGVRQSRARLLPDDLKPAGYRSYHSGKWHIDGPVLPAGFDRSLDMRNHGNYFSSKGNSLDDVLVQPPADERLLRDHRHR
jgi:arylsulfatase